jgi:cell division protein FtsB
LAGLLLALFVYAGFQTAAQQYRVSQERRELEREVAKLELQRAELLGLRAYLGSDEYIEAVARSQFGLVRPGETAVVIEAPESAADERTPGERWWEALFDR